jgi:hypothetical protein
VGSPDLADREQAVVSSKVVTTRATAVITLGGLSIPHWKGTLPIVLYAGPASCKYRPRYCVDKEQY